MVNKFFIDRTFGASRSSRWPAVRKEYLKKHPVCEATGSNKNLSVHHIKPFNYNPELELDHNNLITLSEDFGGSNIHLLLGHLGVFTSHNINIRQDAKQLLNKINTRP